MALDSHIRQIIKKSGYIEVDVMMREVLSSRPLSYYRHLANIGMKGDFVTAPEISQLFGEIIGVWCIEQWQRLGSPRKINLVELGPGQGTMLRDILRIARLRPQFYEALTIELVEINPNFIKLQKQQLSPLGIEIKWLTQIHDIASLPSIIIANEFFDSLPIKQYIKIKDHWQELVFVVEPIDAQIKFDKISINRELQNQLLHDHPYAFDGAILEESPQSLEIIRAICEHLNKISGVHLIIDYGYYVPPWQRTRYQYNPTLQAIKNHQYHPLLSTLGEADLSAHVDFYALKKTAHERGRFAIGPITQREFLIQNGILLRSKLLQQKLSAKEALLVEKQTNYLLEEQKMGTLFKVLCIT